MRALSGVRPFAVVALSMLCGCGGGAGDASLGGPIVDAPILEVSAFDRQLYFGDQIAAETAGLDVTDPAGLPPRGMALYSGPVLMEFTGDLAAAANHPEAMVGTVDLEASFGLSSVSGSLYDFVTPTGERLRGDLRLTDVSIDRASDPRLAPTFVGGLEGSYGRSAETEVWDLAGDFGGVFIGPDGGHSEGGLSGASCRGTACVRADGAFIARRGLYEIVSPP